MRPINGFRSARLARALALAVLSMLPVGGATADDRSASEMQSRRDWFQSLFEPGTDSPCCDIADCKRTIAEWRNGSWWALLQGKWRAIPEASILKRTRSIDGDAYVCTGQSANSFANSSRLSEPSIHCFVPPYRGW